MSPPAQTDDKFTVLVTGANSGLGFGICCRLIDEFLHTRPQSQTLHLLYSTRDVRKSEDTARRLNAHLQKTLRQANGRTLGISLLLEARVKIEGVLVDLTKLLTVKALAQDLVKRGQRLDAVIWNAGIASWKGVNYPLGVWRILTDIVHTTSAPDFMYPDIGLVAAPQLDDKSGEKSGSEPQLGQVFTANVFGHYMLTHWLSPILTPQSRIIWVSSVSALPSIFDLDDLQGIKATFAYEASKRLTDLLVLTSELPSTVPFTRNFLPAPADSPVDVQQPPRPKMYLTHPGIIGTSIAGLNAFMAFWMLAAMYLSRLLGSPWHPVDPYKGAISAVFCALAPYEQLPEREDREGKGKWGSSTDVWGDERVARTETAGWGFCGVVGRVPRGSVVGKRDRRLAGKMGKEEREQFEEDGRRVWREMEELRMEWEKRVGHVDIGDAEDL